METQYDPMTGLYTHRYLRMPAEQLIAEVRAAQAGLGVIMIDIDLFKRFNDIYGHPTGDQFLKTMAHTLKSCLLENELIARYGGEEFLVLTPYSTYTETNELAEKMRIAIQSVTIETKSGPSIPMSITIGCAMCPGQGTALDQLLRVADEALDHGKSSGRNRVMWLGM